MSTLSKVILGFVILAAMAMFYLAMRTLKTHQAWRTAHRNHVKALDDLKAKIVTLEEGTDAPGQEAKSIAKLQTELFGVLYDRGRVWRNCLPRVDAQGVTLTIDVPDPHEIQVGSIIYAFDGDTVATGRYMGEFKVANVGPKTVNLQPTLQRQVPQPRGSWTLYELMPGDSNSIFVDLATGQPLGDADLAALFPKRPGEADQAFLDRFLEYKKDGKAPEDRDPPERIRVLVKFTKDFEQLDQNQRQTLGILKIPQEVVKNGQLLKFDKATADALVGMEAVQVIETTYERPLRDYSFVFREVARQTPVWVDRVESEKKLQEYVTTALKDAKVHETFHNDEITKLTAELARLKAEGTVVSGYQQSLEEKLQAAQARIDAMHAENKQLAAQLAARQREALQRGARPAAAATTAARK